MDTMKKGARVTGEARDTATQEMRAKYESGKSIRQIAEEAGRSYGFVHGILSGAGTTLRGRGGSTRKKATTA